MDNRNICGLFNQSVPFLGVYTELAQAANSLYDFFIYPINVSEF